MTFKKLLAAVSIAALTASSASALDLQATGMNVGVVPATELDLASTPATGVFQLTLTPTNIWPASDNVRSEITLPPGLTLSATWSGAASQSNVPATVVGAGGAVGDSTWTAVFDTSSLTLPNEPIIIEVPIQISSCAGLGGHATMTAVFDGSGSLIEEGSASTGTNQAPTPSTAPIVPMIRECASGLTGTVTSDESSSGDDTFIALNGGFTGLNESPGSAGDFALHDLGTIEYSISMAMAAVTLGNPTTTPTAFSSANVAGVTSTITFGDTTSLDAPTAGGGGTVSGSGPVYSVAYTNSIIGGSSLISVNATSGNTTAIPSQDVTVGSPTVNLLDSTGVDLVASVLGVSGSLDSLQREGQSFGIFDWNGGLATSTLSVYRGTGFTPGVPVDYTVTLSNSPIDGTYDGVVTPNAEGEIVLTSRGFGPAGVPAYSRGDVGFNFETADPVDIDRLMIRNGVVSSFGDDSNSTRNCFFGLGGPEVPSNDGDNGCTGNATE